MEKYRLASLKGDISIMKLKPSRYDPNLNSQCMNFMLRMYSQFWSWHTHRLPGIIAQILEDSVFTFCPNSSSILSSLIFFVTSCHFKGFCLTQNCHNSAFLAQCTVHMLAGGERLTNWVRPVRTVRDAALSNLTEIYKIVWFLPVREDRGSVAGKKDRGTKHTLVKSCLLYFR